MLKFLSPVSMNNSANSKLNRLGPPVKCLTLSTVTMRSAVPKVNTYSMVPFKTTDYVLVDNNILTSLQLRISPVGPSSHMTVSSNLS